MKTKQSFYTKKTDKMKRSTLKEQMEGFEKTNPHMGKVSY